MLAAVLSVAVAGPASGQEAKAAPPSAPAWKITGYVFGDYYYFAQDHDERFDEQQGFWIRRAYLTYDHTLSPRFAARFRVEANSNGKMAGGTLNLYMKDAWLRWTYAGRQQLIVGLQPTPTLEEPDAVWGLRHIERAPADLYRFDATRDTGIALAGPLNAAGTVAYAAQLGNGSGVGSETDGKMATRFTLRYLESPGLFLHASYGRSDLPQGADRQAFQVFTAYQHAKGRAGFNYLWGKRDEAADGSVPGAEVTVVSGFGVLNVRPQKLSLLGRIDRVMDPLPDGSVDYLPISTAAPFTFGLVGVEYYLHPSVRFSPNLELVAYDRPGSNPKPDDDVVVRATFYWAW